MEFDYHRIKNWPFPELEQTYTARDTMLYALGLGIGADSLDAGQLRYVYEKDLQAVPTMAAVLGYPGFWMQNPDTGVDWVKVVHGEQHVRIHRTLPAAATVVGRTRVLSVTDKGAGKGAIVVFETQVSEKQSGSLLATVSQVVFCRGNGGYSANGQPSDELTAAPPVIPLTPPDSICDLGTRPEMALIYRLSADYNPLHADPAVAKAAGFPRPILHGLATFGVAAHALLKSCCGYEAARLQAISTRFSAPVFPGETIRSEIWQRGKQVFFRSRVLERDLVVLNNGVAELA
ncbi:MaoC/PaaZ C-terminal domain-containing protein [Noviherbaspirillum sedimenti]|uniref:3-alpha,7-alpha, 12-alpha-trihydroxy-5-beta-cholest-24-enoyl-CoA hydratase n=1 Tax=Noviherbaspirillum sedimenti TaxID=2320865 RepID=A0A3A3G4P8_9BURK|nr:MaoC/PaaZ C-terminal domain-containing protein [Noviherbaspirillum sedimenti]RJG02911.1 3-alpha,7-alpha,12-alpha-trihydroxy-5-beta-cholest-24-enoyl-CoA hydratase [Noviherbaspirillum sedimenti]